MDKIILRDIKVMATHGVNPEEKIIKQPFNICVTCYLDFKQAARNDDINDTVNYAEMYQQIVREVKNTHFNLIEALAEHLAQMILADKKICQVKVKVEKSEASTGVIIFPAAVEVVRCQEGCTFCEKGAN